MSDATFHRTELAQALSRRLLHPGPLDQALKSGLFLSAPRRVGKTTFLKADLIPVLQAAGALVIYVDLWSQPEANPAELVYDAIGRMLKDLSSPTSAIFKRLKSLSHAELGIGATGFKFSFKLSELGRTNGPLALAFTELVDQARTDVVLIIDEVQHALGSESGNQMLQALKAAREAVNTRPETPGHFRFIGTGSHRAQVQELVVRGNQAFQGALSQPFPVLEEDFVAFILEQASDVLGSKRPSVAAAYEAFKILGHRPEEFAKALTALLQEPAGQAPDTLLHTIARALRIGAAGVELARVDALGHLASEVFSRICLADAPAKGLFTTQALTDYSAQLERPVSTQDVQAALGRLLDENLVMRLEHGRYDVADPFVKEAWREYLALHGRLAK